MDASSTARPRRNTRVLTACDACRLSKTRCDSARPVCAKCVQRGVSCEYPETDAISVSVPIELFPLAETSNDDQFYLKSRYMGRENPRRSRTSRATSVGEPLFEPGGSYFFATGVAISSGRSRSRVNLAQRCAQDAYYWLRHDSQLAYLSKREVCVDFSNGSVFREARSLSDGYGLLDASYPRMQY